MPTGQASSFNNRTAEYIHCGGIMGNLKRTGNKVEALRANSKAMASLQYDFGKERDFCWCLSLPDGSST